MILTLCLPILFIEKEFIYDVVVRSSTTTEDSDSQLLVTKSSFRLADFDGDWIQMSNSTAERATSAHSIARTLTGSSQFFSS